MSRLIEWAQILETGEYEDYKYSQLQYELGVVNKNKNIKEVQACCLGVACHALNLPGFRLEEYSKKSDLEAIWCDGNFESLDPDAMKELGIDELSSNILINLNDELNWSFKQIAKFVRLLTNEKVDFSEEERGEILNILDNVGIYRDNNPKTEIKIRKLLNAT